MTDQASVSRDLPWEVSHTYYPAAHLIGRPCGHCGLSEVECQRSELRYLRRANAEQTAELVRQRDKANLAAERISQLNLLIEHYRALWHQARRAQTRDVAAASAVALPDTLPLAEPSGTLPLHPPPPPASPIPRDACHANSDGECDWQNCPQLADNEPARSGRHCPLDLCPHGFRWQSCMDCGDQ